MRECQCLFCPMRPRVRCFWTATVWQMVRGKGGWWDWHPSKTALEYLWRSGQISVARRDGFRKIYDLTERVIPPEQLNAYRSDADTIEWACGAALDRLGFATSGELAAFWNIVTPAEAKVWATAAIADGRAVWVDVESADGALRRSLARPDMMDTIPKVAQRLRIVSPFDPALRDRKRAHDRSDLVEQTRKLHCRFDRGFGVIGQRCQR